MGFTKTQASLRRTESVTPSLLRLAGARTSYVWISRAGPSMMTRDGSGDARNAVQAIRRKQECFR
jgi:hypothetical protein